MVRVQKYWFRINHEDVPQLEQKYLVSDIEEGIYQDTTPTSEPEYPLPVLVIPDEGQISRTNRNINLSEPMFLKKANEPDKSS